MRTLIILISIQTVVSYPNYIIYYLTISILFFLSISFTIQMHVFKGTIVELFQSEDYSQVYRYQEPT